MGPGGWQCLLPKHCCSPVYSYVDLTVFGVQGCYNKLLQVWWLKLFFPLTVQEARCPRPRSQQRGFPPGPQRESLRRASALAHGVAPRARVGWLLDVLLQSPSSPSHGLLLWVSVSLCPDFPPLTRVPVIGLTSLPPPIQCN